MRRRLIRDAISPDLPVLYLQGPAETSPWNQLASPQRWNGEQRLKEVGALLAGETLRLLHRAPPVADPLFRHIAEDLALAVRLPSDEALAHARRVVQSPEDAGHGGYVLAQSGVLRLYDEFNASPSESLSLHAVRIGDYAISTNPCELYCQFGHDIRRRSPAQVTAIAQLADGFSGYVPTIPGLMGGGYSGDAIYWCRLEPYAGYKVVEASARLLRLWS